MRALSSLATALVLASVAALVPGCTVNHDDGGGSGTGTATVDWTIDDSKSGDECNSNDVASIQITVIDANGNNQGTYEQACAAFATTIPLPPGNYTANAVLVDGNDHPLTTTIAIDAFNVYSDQDLDIPIDFPQSSFL